MNNLDKPHTPYVIAHRGLSSLLPENTIESVMSSMECSDFAEIDVMLTKDDQAVVFHDYTLSALTNIDQFPQFSSRKRLGKEDGVEKNDYWIEDFTLQELQTLRVKQRINTDKRPHIWNWMFKIPSLKELFDSVLSYKKVITTGRNSGLMIELKDQHQEHRNEMLVIKVVDLLREKGIETSSDLSTQKLPILLASFSEQVVEMLHRRSQNHIIQLLDVEQPYNLENVKKNSWAIGITDQHIIRTEFALAEQCHKNNLRIMYWTVANDRKEIPFGFKNIDQVYLKLLEIKIDGIICQFPEYASAIVNSPLRTALC